MKKISTSSTKTEILEAYEEAVSYLNEQKAENLAVKKEINDKSKIVNNAKDLIISNNPIDTIEAFRNSFNSQINELKTKVLDEKEKFEKIQQAISIEKETVENIYKIKAEAESLEALIYTNKKAKENIELELKQVKMDWKREEEEFDYNLKIKRRNEEDIYLQKKLKLEQDLKENKEKADKQISDRETTLKNKEIEFIELKENSLLYEINLKNALEKTEKEVSEKLKKDFDFEQKLENKDLDVKIKLLQQEIDSLKLKVKEQQGTIIELNDKATKASDQVKDIALKAIEGASSSRWVGEKREDRKD
jgi:hypothetical protein